LALLAVAGMVTALRAWSSVTNYHTPYNFHADLPSGPALTDRVVLVVLDGVRADAAESMPSLQKLARGGSSGIVHTGVPSLSNPSRAVMVTGAWQEVNGVTTNSHFQPPPVDSLFSLARKAGLPTAVAGSFFWRDAFGADLDPRRTQVHQKRLRYGASLQELIAWQQETCRADRDFLSHYAAGLLVVGVTAADSAGHDYGGRSEPYRQAVAAVDSCVGSIVPPLDDGRTTLIVTSDHGHIDLRGHGGHGGVEHEVVNVPLVLAGKAIRSSHGWRAEQVDIAPTICILLGLPLPATNQGSVLWQALDVPADLAPALHDREAQQHALAAQHFADPQQVRSDQKRGRSLRALALFTSAWFVGCAIALDYRRSWRWLLVALGLYYAVYYALFFALGMQYSLSAINREEYLSSFFRRDLAAAAVAFAVAGTFLLRKVEAPGVRSLLDFAVLVGCSVVIQVTWIYFEYGLFMQNVMLDLPQAFKAYLDLLQLAALGVTAPAFALLYAVANRRRPVVRQTSPSNH
jgi:Type I phosphodiesterase / nucleotide pyrophosphatase